MSTTKEFTDAVRSWAGVFMQRSMTDLSRFMRAADLSMPQANALMRLYHQNACGVSDIGRHLGISNAAASQMAERMVRQGLLERKEQTGDRRVRRLSLTPKGRALVQRIIRARQDWLGQLSDRLTDDQRTAAVEALNWLAASARDMGVSAPDPEPRPGRRTARAARAVRPR